MAIGDFSNLSIADKETAILRVAQNQAKQARLSLQRLAAEAHNAEAYLLLSRAIYEAKNLSGLNWTKLADKLGNPCGEEMLRKIATRGKTPSDRTYKAICEGLKSLYRGYSLPSPRLLTLTNGSDYGIR